MSVSMTAPARETFFGDLPLHLEPLAELVAQPALFQTVPESWHVVITDIKGSTNAVEAGQNQLVNLIASGSIIAALNVAYEQRIEIPFFFGGDGATLLLPPSLLEPIVGALTQHRNNAWNTFGMDLRVGCVPVREVYEQGHQLLLAKTRLRPIYTMPVVLGQGLGFAESLIKSSEQYSVLPTEFAAPLNLDGMECRWNAVKPPRNKQEVVSLLVDAQAGQDQGKVFKQVLLCIDQIYGQPVERHPISVNRLRLSSGLRKLRAEMKTRLGESDWRYLLKNWLITLYGHIYFLYDRQGRDYLEALVELSDTLVIDGRINTVITGTTRQREQLVAQLQSLEDLGILWYGWHSSPESIMSCYVRNRLDQHVHFVDGAGGGYTQAARMLKKKLKSATS